MSLEQGRMPRLALPTDRYSAIYAIGDVHGCHDALLALEEKIIADAEGLDGRKLIIMLGDYVDRGPKSATVLYHLTAPAPAGFDRICLRGNHDDAFLDYLDGDPAGDWFLDHGAEQTIASYGVDLALAGVASGSNHKLREAVRAAVPSGHVEFLRALPVMLTIGDDVFVHAGIRPGRPLVDQTDEDLIWIRRVFLDLGPGLPVRVIHGHTPIRRAHVAPDRIGVDTHCYKTGRLTAVRLMGGDVAIFDTAEAEQL